MKEAFAMCALMVVAAGAGAQRPLTWTLATDDTRLVMAANASGIQVTALSAVKRGRNWLPSPSPVPLMPRVWVDGQEHPTAWHFTGAARDRRVGTLTLMFANDSPSLTLRSIWRARRGRGPVEHRLEVENRSGGTIAVGHQDSLSLSGLAPGGAAEVHWMRRGGSNASTEGGVTVEPVAPGLDRDLVSNCEDGASPVPWMAVQVAEREGLYVGWEFSGLGRVSAAGRPGAALDVQVGLLPDFRTDIGPGETFHVPAAFVGCYAGDIDEGAYSLHRFIVEKLRPAVPTGTPDPILTYNLYLDVGGNNAKEADVLRSARFCKEIGFEAFMPDAMWFPETGDWRWDPKRFPSGSAPIERYVHEVGMQFALWCAWTNGGVSPDPGALSISGPSAHPDWFRADVAPDWQPGPFYGAQVCLGCDEARAWELAKLKWLAGHDKLDYLKHDIGPIVTSCTRTDHRHHYGVDASYWAAAGYYEVQEKLREAYPRLILENCSGGGHIKDFGVIQRTHYTVTTDTLSNLPDRQSIWDSTFAFPPLLLQAYTYDNQYPVKGDSPGPFLWRSAMMGAWQIDPTDTPKWTDEERDSARAAARIYKEWIRPTLRDAKVHHVLPRPDGVHWDGLFLWSPRLKRGTFYVFRPDAAEDQQTVRLRGLEVGREYWVWCEDGSVEPRIRTGDELMGTGLTVRLPQRYTCDLVYVRDASLGKPRGLEVPGTFVLLSPELSSDAFGASARLRWSASAGARSYRVVLTRAGEPLVDRVVSGTAVTLPRLPESAELRWQVQATSWGGRRESEGGEGSFTTPAGKPLPGITFVSDMSWVSATAGAGNSPHRDANYSGAAISLAGKQCPKGVWTHSFEDGTPADLTLDVEGKGYAEFAAEVGLDDASGGGSVQFQVLVDGAVRAETRVLKPGQVQPLRVDVAGARRVVLRVLNGGDGYTCDHAAWGMARFLAVGAQDPFGDRSNRQQ